MLLLAAYLGEVIPVVLFLYNLPIQGFPGMPELLIPVMLCFPYMFLHRRWPLTAFVVIASAAYVQLMAGIGLLVADGMLVLALYSLARVATWRRSIPAALVVGVWSVLISVPARSDYGWSIGDVALLVFAPATAWLLGILSQTRRRYVLSLEERARQAEREQKIRARVAVVEERTRIARELHDIVSHGLSAIVLMSDGATSVARTDPDAAARAMQTVSQTGRTAMTEMRSMLSVLRAEGTNDSSPAPSLEDLDALIEQSRSMGVPVTMEVTGTPLPIGAGAELTIYRVVQEALTNVRKHAGMTTAVQVHLRWRNDEVAVEVTDDGEKDSTSTDTEGVSATAGGLGLTGMRERVIVQGGELELISGPPSSGFRVLATLPVDGGDRG